MLALYPPGPQRREANLLASRRFARCGDPSCLLFPDAVLLAGSSGPRPEVSRLSGLWEGIDGNFSSSMVEIRGDKAYLVVKGPLAELRRRGEALFKGGLDHPFEGGIGFYLGGVLPPEEAVEEDQVASFSWWSCRLVLLEISGDWSRGGSFSWREGAVAWRPKDKGGKGRESRDGTVT